MKSFKKISIFLIFASNLFVFQNFTISETNPCSKNVVAQVLKKTNVPISLKCDLTLKKGDVLTRGILFEGAEASGHTLNCKGATIDGSDKNASKYQIAVRSKLIKGEWSVPQNITIRDCKILGAVRIYGMATNGQGDILRDSSRSEGHTKRAQEAAPRNIQFQNIKFVANGTTPLYISPGVRHVTVENSHFSGGVSAASIYLDAESANNVIRNNTFQAKRLDGNKREVISVDGSAGNTIVGNYFSGLGYGGIFLYRNCGEGGTIRHQSPVGNKLINNVFYYDEMKDNFNFWQKAGIDIFNLFSSNDIPDEFLFPSIWLGSRNGGSLFINYCNEDKGYPFGSSADNRDLVKNSVLLDNRIIKLNVNRMINKNEGALIYNNNISVSGTNLGTALTPTKRISNCFVKGGFPSPYLKHGEFLKLFSDHETGLPVCKGRLLTCDDGKIIRSPVSCENAPVFNESSDVQDFECRKMGSNSGCTGAISCPNGTSIVSLKAECNLEFGEVTEGAVKFLPWNTIRVKRASSNASAGKCFIEGAEIKINSRSLSELRGRQGIAFGCKEHDDNGGDCHIRGQLFCK